eukprot:TRINITY_DN993_c0_g1_i1.p1 TRINITY_DN993_c0_g1~~TRINITY_DN993_c0_g1_i1.p1  ORF type:complete len:253 (+),score=58.20 TRINITY_DN993_c0_g1_i1:79-837(+)
MAASNWIVTESSEEEQQLLESRGVRRLLSGKVPVILMSALAICAVGAVAFHSSSSQHHGLRPTKIEDRSLLGTVGEVKTEDYISGDKFRYNGPSGLGSAIGVHAKQELVFVRWLALEGQQVQYNDPLLLAKVDGQEVQVRCDWPGYIRKTGNFKSGDVIKEGVQLVIIGHPRPQPSGLFGLFILMIFVVGAATFFISAWFQIKRSADSSATQQNELQYEPVHHQTADAAAMTAKEMSNLPGLPRLSMAAQRV